MLRADKVTQNAFFSFPIYVLQGQDGQKKRDKMTRKEKGGSYKKGVTTKEL